MLLLLFILEVLGICFLLSLSAFFSGSETAFFSLRKWRVLRLQNSGVRGSYVAELLSNPKNLIATILICNETVNIAASNLAAIIRRDYFSAFGTAGVLTALIVMTVLIFFFGEVTPKVIAIYSQERWALAASVPMSYIFKAISPVRKVVERITDKFSDLLMTSSGAGSDGVQMEELRSIMRESAGEAGLSVEEAKIAESIFDMSEIPVKTVMIPRPRIVAMKENTTLEEASTIMQRTKFSRFPVYGDDIDDIKGVVYAKELLAAYYGLSSIGSVKEISRPVLFVPETKVVFDVLRDFQAKQIHLAVILDEYGGTAGIITIDDILREVVGDIGDRFRPSKYPFKRLSDGMLIIDGSISLQEFNEISGGNIEDPDIETVAGYVVKMMGRIPSEGEEIRIGQFSFKIVKMSGKRVAVIEARIIDGNSGSIDG